MSSGLLSESSTWRSVFPYSLGSFPWLENGAAKVQAFVTKPRSIHECTTLSLFGLSRGRKRVKYLSHFKLQNLHFSVWFAEEAAEQGRPHSRGVTPLGDPGWVSEPSLFPEHLLNHRHFLSCHTALHLHFGVQREPGQVKHHWFG